MASPFTGSPMPKASPMGAEDHVLVAHRRIRPFQLCDDVPRRDRPPRALQVDGDRDPQRDRAKPTPSRARRVGVGFAPRRGEDAVARRRCEYADHARPRLSAQGEELFVEALRPLLKTALAAGEQQHGRRAFRVRSGAFALDRGVDRALRPSEQRRVLRLIAENEHRLSADVDARVVVPFVLRRDDTVTGEHELGVVQCRPRLNARRGEHSFGRRERRR
ncbi:MAG TPA: hypothetical protein VHK90_02670, partial [Thermoanaerobaculia bacterium]|nr:hypothetical protein [Thermoanaerobaculia bacterium]